MKKIVILYILFCLSYAVKADWQEETPNGKIMNDVWLDVKGKYIQGIEEFYFYNDCIIGKSNKTYGDLKSGYFVINEKTGSIDTFKTEQDWKSYIETHNLEPLIWKRIYTEGWSQTLIYFFILFSFLLPSFIVYRIFKPMLNLPKNIIMRYSKSIAIIILSLFLFRYFLDVFPESI